jgi:Rrf2 family protein
MKLSRTTEYALQATLELAQSTTGCPVSSTHLASSSSMPERFLLQVLRNLVTHGILSSTRGVVGGYRLHRRPADISLLDLIEAIEGPVVGGLTAGNVLSENIQVTVRVILENIAESTRSHLDRITLADLLQSPAESLQASVEDTSFWLDTTTY